MLLRQLNCELCYYVSGVSLEGGVEGSLSINNDESEWRLAYEKLLFQIVDVESGIAGVDGEVDGLEGFEIANKFFLGC